MKTLTSVLLLMSFFFVSSLFAQTSQDRQLQYSKPADKHGLNMFETTKEETSEFVGFKVILGGSSTLQFQGLNHSNSSLFVDDGNGANINELIELENNFNLATANLDLDVQLHNGLRMHLRTYLSSRHHSEPYVKSGYLQVDRLDFVSPGFLDNVMDMVTLKVGHMEINYGDAHFRRSDNSGFAFINPKKAVGGLILKSRMEMGIKPVI